MDDCLPPVGAHVYVGSGRYRAVIVDHNAPPGHVNIRFGSAKVAVRAPAKLCVLAFPPNQPGPLRGI